MAEEIPQAETAVTETPQTPVPSVPEQKTPEPEHRDGLPEEVKERTKSEFEKLRNDLREERSRREQIEAAFQAQLQPKKTEQTEVPIVDPTTGLIDERALTALQKEAREARQEAAKAREEFTTFKQRGEYEKAYQKYDWTNPQSKNFDEKRSNLAAAIALASMVEPKKYGGKQLDLEGAASFVEGLTSKEIAQVREQAATEAIEKLSPKEQAALEATGSSGRRSEADAALDYESVRVATRKGGNESIVATMARLRALKKNQASSA